MILKKGRRKLDQNLGFNVQFGGIGELSSGHAGGVGELSLLPPFLVADCPPPPPICPRRSLLLDLW
jgi:hypothetical protein